MDAHPAKFTSLLLLTGLLACSGTQEKAEPVAGHDAGIDATALAEFSPLPPAPDHDTAGPAQARVDLGRMLYYDTRLSSTGDVSCYTCHPLHDYGTSHRTRGVGVGQQQGPRNDPSVYNSSLQVAQFWDGRAATLEDQAGGPVLNPIEMGMRSQAAVERKIRSIPGYDAAFRRAFPDDPDPVSFNNFRRAVAAFEEGLITPSRWDRYLEGDPSALTPAEKEGFRTFISLGCSSCHYGVDVGGRAFQRLGVAHPWPDTADLGRYKVTGEEGDRMVFKVPSLRNVVHTWPYLHDGSVRRLDDAVRLMARYQTGQEPTDAQVTSVVTWLNSLTGQVPEDYIQDPRLPPDPEDVSLEPAVGG